MVGAYEGRTNGHGQNWAGSSAKKAGDGLDKQAAKFHASGNTNPAYFLTIP